MNPYPEHTPFNALKAARLPVDEALRRDWPWTLIKTSGEDVGLPGIGDDATMGNSEVGHQNIGAGRVVPQESLVMTRACRDGLHTNPAIKAAVERLKAGNTPAPGPGSRGRALHLLGINSDAGVHGLLEHLYAILRAAKHLGAPADRVFIHLFTDGRDAGPFTGKDAAERVHRACTSIGLGRIASIVGRYYAMDRDHRWERVALAYDLLTGRANTPAAAFPVFTTAAEAIQSYYDNPDAYAPAGLPSRKSNMQGDEFILPRLIAASLADAHTSRVQSGDSVIFFNYRGDRPRELSAAFCFPDDLWAKVKPSPDSGKAGFDRGHKLDLHYVIMTEYWEKLIPHVSGVAFPKPPKMTDTLGETLSKAGLTQFRCAETEKYPHVTFFFNDYRDEPFDGEHRENPQSPKVNTYDQKPEMSAPEVRDAVLRRLAATDREDVLIVNFANGDMVGHTGNLAAAVKACETVDACVGQIVEAALKAGGSLIVTADHGNAEQMFDPQTGSPHTAHTNYDVPLIIVGPAFKGRKLRGDQSPTAWANPQTRANRGRLGDIAPTMLAMLGLPKPSAMTGESLFA
jgi:2,3-bisphosphoglycerate-independent phosphoglycerate mutase